MSAKGYDMGNGPADRLLLHVHDRFHPIESEVRKALPAILTAERNRTIASLRGRWDRRKATHASRMTDVGEVFDVIEALLDEMEQDSSA